MQVEHLPYPEPAVPNSSPCILRPKGPPGDTRHLARQDYWIWGAETSGHAHALLTISLSFSSMSLRHGKPETRECMWLDLLAGIRSTVLKDPYNIVEPWNAPKPMPSNRPGLEFASPFFRRPYTFFFSFLGILPSSLNAQTNDFSANLNSKPYT